MHFWFVNVIPQYLKFAALSEELLAVIIPYLPEYKITLHIRQSSVFRKNTNVHIRHVSLLLTFCVLNILELNNYLS
jgi:hypothetical protein